MTKFTLMKNILMLSCSLLIFISCKNEQKKPIVENEVSYASFGEKIGANDALSAEEMLERYQSLKPGDTVEVKFKTTINEVCKKKGCWMTMELGKDKEAFVKFKDYGFFVPKNADKSEAIVSGKAFMDSISVNDLRHYAKDGGKSEKEIAQITAPEVKYSFQANGVLIQK
jgi:hypothetical protein